MVDLPRVSGSLDCAAVSIFKDGKVTVVEELPRENSGLGTGGAKAVEPSHSRQSLYSQTLGLTSTGVAWSRLASASELFGQKCP